MKPAPCFRPSAVLLAALAGLGACGGPLANARLMPVEESRHRVLLSATFPSMEGLDQAIHSWDTATPKAAAVTRDIVFQAYSVPIGAAQMVATDRPISLAVVRADVRDADGKSMPTLVNALAFTLKKGASSKDWLKALGVFHDSVGSFYLIRGGVPIALGQGLLATAAFVHTGNFWVHLDGDQVMLSSEQLGLIVAGPAAKAAWRSGSDEIVVDLQPQVLPRGFKLDLAKSLSKLMTALRQGRATQEDAVSQTGELLGAANALYYLRALTDASAAQVTVNFDRAGVELHLRTTPGPDVATSTPLQPAFDRALLTDKPPAALGALDCNARLFGRQPMLNAVWKGTGGPGSDELNALVKAQEGALEGSCSFVVRTDNELWAEEASYPLRPDASPAPLTDALVAAIRAGGLPNLQSGLDDLTTAKFLFTHDADTLGIDRVLGATTTPETRHAAALHGGAILHDRFSVRGGRFLSTSGAKAAERLEQIAKPAPGGPLPEELERALSTGRGKGGFAFFDLTALWKPYLKAGQVIDSPLSAAVAAVPDLIKIRRPLVITVEPTTALDTTAAMPPPTFIFLFAVAAILFGG